MKKKTVKKKTAKKKRVKKKRVEQNLAIEKLYEQIGANYRFFLNWRHASLAGYLLVLWGVVSLSISAYEGAREVAWLVPLGGFPFGVLFCMLDHRTKAVFQDAIKAGREIEAEAGREIEAEGWGYFSHLKSAGVVPRKDQCPIITHTLVLRIIYLGSSFVLAVLAAYLKFALALPAK